jgi:hypothetical protein
VSFFGTVTQLVECQIEDLMVGSSNLPGTTILNLKLTIMSEDTRRVIIGLCIVATLVIAIIQGINSDIEEKLKNIPPPKEYFDAVSEYNYNLLLTVGQLECGICDTTEILRVLSVVIRRVEDSRFPSTIDSVLNQEINGKKQFSGFQKNYTGPISDKVRWSVEYLFETDSLLVPANVLGFYNPSTYTDTVWIKKIEPNVVYREKYHNFYTL